MTYIDVLSICLTSEFSLYGKRNVVCFFHLQSEAKLNVRFTLIFILIIYTRWQIVKKRGGSYWDILLNLACPGPI